MKKLSKKTARRFTAGDQTLALNAPENVRKYHYVLNGEVGDRDFRLITEFLTASARVLS